MFFSIIVIPTLQFSEHLEILKLVSMSDDTVEDKDSLMKSKLSLGTFDGL